MDKKELLRRWTLGYVEPSLFYLPQKDSDEYYTVTIIPQIDYFDTYDEKVITDVTFGDVYTKGYINASNNKFGGLAYSDMIRESNFYVAYDTQGNVADCSLWRDFMSMAVCRYSDDKGSYILEYYHAPSFLSDSNQEIRVIKNVPNTEYAKLIFDDGWGTYYNNYGNSVLFIFESGEIYVWKLADSTTNPWTYEMTIVGYYDYKTDKYYFDDKDFYFTYMILGNYWNTPNNQPALFSASGQVLMDNVHAILRLKKGTYTIEQGVSSIGCDMMPVQTITVNGNMTLYYKTTLNGIIIRSELQDCADPYHLLYDNSNNPPWKDKWFIESGSYGSLECTNYTYRLSDYALQVKQQLVTWCGDGSNIPSEDGSRINYYTGKHIRFFTTNDGTKDGEVIGYMFDNILSKRALTADECSVLGISDYKKGTLVNPTVAYYYVNQYVEFYVSTYYKLPNGYPTDINKYDYYPTTTEIEEAINKKSLIDWCRSANDTEYKGEFIKEDEYATYYVNGGTTQTINTYQNPSNARTQVLFSDTVYTNDNSTVNMVVGYGKADTANIDEYMKYINNTSQRYDSIQLYNEDGSPSGSQTQYKNYVTCVSPEYKISDRWTDEEYFKLQEQMKSKLFEEQLK